MLPRPEDLGKVQKMTHGDFLELVLADEVTRREAKSASRPALALAALWPRSFNPKLPDPGTDGSALTLQRYRAGGQGAGLLAAGG